MLHSTLRFQRKLTLVYYLRPLLMRSWKIWRLICPGRMALRSSNFVTNLFLYSKVLNLLVLIT